MKYAFVKWKNWDAVKCITGDTELIVGFSAGPRILSVKYKAGLNLLYEDGTDFKVGDWRLFGGHRFTIAPENPDSYFPDNESCTVKLIASKLVITTSERLPGIRLSLIIGLTDSENEFEITHSLENTGNEPWIGALWAITCVPRTAIIQANCTSVVNYWPQTDPNNWVVNNNKMTISNGLFRGKTGWHSNDIFLNAHQTQGLLEIRVNEFSSPAECVDNGSNVELFVCPDFIELETLSRQYSILPDKSASHCQLWKITPNPEFLQTYSFH